MDENDWRLLMEIISVKEASEKWSISERRVQKLREEGRILLRRIGHRAWASSSA
jgi:hypothetical protein